MNEIFNFKRFGQMLAVDFNRVFSSYGLSLLILCFAEVIIFLISYAVGQIIGEPVNMELSIRMTIYSICMVVLIFTMPQKCYGFITDKSKGSAYLSLPASSLEKFISMLLLTTLLTAIFVLGSLSVDALLCHCFPNSFTNLDSVQITEDMWVKHNVKDISSLTPSILTFLLGALWFKKGKAGKTLLCLMAMVLILFVINLLLDNWDTMASEQILVRDIKFACYCYTAMFVAVLVLIYLRVRKIQH